MKSWSSSLLGCALLGVLGWLVLAGASTTKSALKEPNKLVILSTTDVKGEYDPCG